MNLKKKFIPLLGLVAALTITGCNKPNKSNSINPSDSIAESSNSNGGNTSNSASQSDVVEDYPISVTNTTGVTITVNKKRAVKGEKVTFTVELATGYKLKGVSVTNATVTEEAAGQYSFLMPERPVRITAQVEIDGDFVIVGEFAAQLQKEGDIYVARNIKIPYNKDYAEFSYVVQKDGKSTKLPSLALDETRCFANVSFTSNKENELRVATGCTYDFFYDPNSEMPCYVIRKSVDQVPQNGESLFTRVFDGRMRSEPTLHAPDLKAIDYTYSTNELKYDYHYKKYNNYVSLATIEDKTNVNDVQNYYVYKKADFTNNVYEVVNTWPKYLGNNENEYALWELDPYGDSMDDSNSASKTHKAFSARLDITPVETDTRMEISVRDAKRNVAMGAHYGAELEYEFYDAYRAVFGDVYINAPSWVNPGYSIETHSDGTFKVTVNSTVEYDTTETAGVADAENHSGHTNNLVINFAKNGAVLDLDWTRSDYTQSQWNFQTHTPVNANQGVIKHVTCTNTYGDAYTGTPNFDSSKYFISSISKASWYNKENSNGKSATVSNVCFGDTLEFYAYGDGGKKSYNTDEFVFAPTTALDAWQYGVMATSDKNVVDINGQRKYEVVNVGSATVTIGNRTQNSNNVTKDITIAATAIPCALGFYFDFRVYGYDSYNCENAEIAVGKAGRTGRYYVDVSSESGKKAPCSYYLKFNSGEKNEDDQLIWSNTTPYFTVESTGHVLTLNFNTEASLALTKTIEVSARVYSDYYQPGRPKTTFTIRILPKNANDDVVNSHWVCNYLDDNGAQLDDQTDIYFYNRKYEGNDNIYVGKIVDYITTKTDSYTNVYNFIYQVNGMGMITGAQITSVEFEHPSYQGTSYKDFNLYFGGVSDTGLLLVCLWYETSSDLAPIFGSGYMDEEYQIPVIESWQGFTKVA